MDLLNYNSNKFHFFYILFGTNYDHPRHEKKYNPLEELYLHFYFHLFQKAIYLIHPLLIRANPFKNHHKKEHFFDS